MVFKRCFIPCCLNDTENSDKIFISVPLREEIRVKWFHVFDKKYVFTRTKNVHCCEDHFDLENDVVNWVRYKMMTSSITLREGVVPHKFIDKPSASAESQLSLSDRKLKAKFIDTLTKGRSMKSSPSHKSRQRNNSSTSNVNTGIVIDNKCATTHEISPEQPAYGMIIVNVPCAFLIQTNGINTNGTDQVTHSANDSQIENEFHQNPPSVCAEVTSKEEPPEEILDRNDYYLKSEIVVEENVVVARTIKTEINTEEIDHVTHSVSDDKTENELHRNPPPMCGEVTIKEEPPEEIFDRNDYYLKTEIVVEENRDCQKRKKQAIFECSICHKTWTRLCNLNYHMNQHKQNIINDKGKRTRKYLNRKKAYLGAPTVQKCDVCQETFTYVFHLIKHVREAHGSMRRYECPVCPNTFKNSKTLCGHMKLHDRFDYCKICHKTFYKRRNGEFFENHIKAHNLDGLTVP